MYDALVWYNLRHENIVPCLGILNDRQFNGYCFVLPWYENGDARQYLEKNASSWLSQGEYTTRVNKIVRTKSPDGVSMMLTTAKSSCMRLHLALAICTQWVSFMVNSVGCVIQ